MSARSQLAPLFFDRQESLAMASPPPSLESLAMAYPPPSPPCDADCYTEQYILQIGIPVGVVAFLAICCLCYGCCSTSPDGSCYDDCCSDAWTVFCLPCRCATHLCCMPFVSRCVSEDSLSRVEKRVPKPVPPSVVLAQAAKRTRSAHAKIKALPKSKRSKQQPEWQRQPSAEDGGASAV